MSKYLDIEPRYIKASEELKRLASLGEVPSSDTLIHKTIEVYSAGSSSNNNMDTTNSILNMMSGLVELDSSMLDTSVLTYLGIVPETDGFLLRSQVLYYNIKLLSILKVDMFNNAYTLIYRWIESQGLKDPNDTYFLEPLLYICDEDNTLHLDQRLFSKDLGMITKLPSVNESRGIAWAIYSRKSPEYSIALGKLLALYDKAYVSYKSEHLVNSILNTLCSFREHYDDSLVELFMKYDTSDLMHIYLDSILESWSPMISIRKREPACSAVETKLFLNSIANHNTADIGVNVEGYTHLNGIPIHSIPNREIVEPEELTYILNKLAKSNVKKGRLYDKHFTFTIHTPIYLQLYRAGIRHCYDTAISLHVTLDMDIPDVIDLVRSKLKTSWLHSAFDLIDYGTGSKKAKQTEYIQSLKSIIKFGNWSDFENSTQFLSEIKAIGELYSS